MLVNYRPKNAWIWRIKHQKFPKLLNKKKIVQIFKKFTFGGATQQSFLGLIARSSGAANTTEHMYTVRINTYWEHINDD